MEECLLKMGQAPTGCGAVVLKGDPNNIDSKQAQFIPDDSYLNEEDEDENAYCPQQQQHAKKQNKKYRQRKEVNAQNETEEYLKYKQYKKERQKYDKMEQLINHLLSMHPANLQHLLLLKKSDYLSNINRIQQTLSDYNTPHLPQLLRVSESLSFYAISFKAINSRYRKLWHILLQQMSMKTVQINEQRISLWIKQLLNALSFLHRHNIVHLDVSPESILISDTLDNIILSGFDCSMLVNDHITYSMKCELLNCCWQLPPSIRRRNDFNGYELKSFDMWSVGVLTFLLLTAKFPFFKDKNNKKIIESEYVKHYQKISHSARDFVSKLLASSHTNRLTVSDALNHEWIQLQKSTKRTQQKKYTINGRIYASMYQHHQTKLKKKYKILQQQIQKKLFVSDKKRIKKPSKKLNKKIVKYQMGHSSLNLTKSQSKFFLNNHVNFAQAEDDNPLDTATDYSSLYKASDDNCDNANASPSSSSSSSDIADNFKESSSMSNNSRSRNEIILRSPFPMMMPKHKSKAANVRRASHQITKKYDIKQRVRSNSEHTYTEYINLQS